MSSGFFCQTSWSRARPLEWKVTPRQNTQVKFSDSASAHGLHAIQSQTVLTIDYLVFSHFFSDSNSLNVDVFWFTSLRSDSKLNIFGSQWKQEDFGKHWTTLFTIFWHFRPNDWSINKKKGKDRLSNNEMHNNRTTDCWHDIGKCILLTIY